MHERLEAISEPEAAPEALADTVGRVIAEVLETMFSPRRFRPRAVTSGWDRRPDPAFGLRGRTGGDPLARVGGRGGFHRLRVPGDRDGRADRSASGRKCFWS